MPRFFKLAEAERLLPEVEVVLRSIIQFREDYGRAEEELSRLLQQISTAGGMIPPRERIAQLRHRKDAAARSLQSSLERLEEIGCQLKDVETGLIDVPTLYHGREVLLCWRLGEPKIAFWHGVEDGFRGRQPIDSEFLENHSDRGNAGQH